MLCYPFRCFELNGRYVEEKVINEEEMTRKPLRMDLRILTKGHAFGIRMVGDNWPRNGR